LTFQRRLQGYDEKKILFKTYDLAPDPFKKIVNYFFEYFSKPRYKRKKSLLGEAGFLLVYIYNFCTWCRFMDPEKLLQEDTFSVPLSLQ
jgi:hypothetical protein